jgi:hypothetical protein
MVAAQRFGLAFGVAPPSRKKLEDVLGASLGEALMSQRESLTAEATIDRSGEHATLILDHLEAAFSVAVALQEAAWPVPLRHALIVSPPAGAAGRDEAVRSKAAVALRTMSRHEAFRFDLPAKGEDERALADVTAAMHRRMILDLTRQRLQAVRAYRRLGRQAPVAEKLGISQQAVSQLLVGARFRLLQRTENAVAAWLTRPQRTTLWPLKGRS